MSRFSVNKWIVILQMSVLLICYIQIFAQNTDIKFETYSTKDGLNQNSILAIHQDDEGFLWFGTYAGLNRYDGYNFIKLPYNIVNTDSVNDMHIRTICQDEHGILLIGTTNGLHRFFAYTREFVNYRNDPKDSNSLSENVIYKLLKDKDGDVWIGTWGGGLDKMEKIKGNYEDEQNAKFQFIHHKPKEGVNSISSLFIADMAEAPDGTIWIATNEGLNAYNKQTNEFVVFKHDPKNSNSLSNNDVSSVCVDKKGNIWAGTWEGGLNMYNPKTNKFSRFRNDPKDKYSLSHNIVMSLYCDKSGNLWIGTWGGGLNRLLFPNENIPDYNKTDPNKKFRFINYKSNKTDLMSISGNSIYSIFEDREGIIWVGTDWAGVNKFELKTSKFRHIYSEQRIDNSLVNNIIYTVMLDNNLLWIGTEGGLNVYDRKKDVFKLYQSDPDNLNTLNHNHARAILKDRKGRIWLGTDVGLNKYNPENDNFTNYSEIFEEPGKAFILTLYESNSGEIWIGTYGEGLYRFNPDSKTFIRYLSDPNDPESLSDNIIWDIIEDKQKNLWIGTGSGGLCQFDEHTDKFLSYKHNPQDSNSLSNNLVMSLFIDHNNDFWIGTLRGLDKLEYGSKSKIIFKHYEEEDGLASPTVNGIVEDNDQHLWLTTTQGLTKFDPSNNKFLSYHVEDGLQDNEFSINAILVDTVSGEIIAGGINGLNIFHPDKIRGDNVIPETKIVDLKLFHQSVTIGQNIDGRIILPQDICYTDYLELTYNENVVSFEYSAVDYHSPQGNKYAYMLNGYDRDWNIVDNERSATYRNLPPGRYTFMVKASSKDGTWGDKYTSLDLFVKPPWWNTIVFKILTVLVLLSVLLSIFLLRDKILKKRQYLLEQTVKKRTEQLSEANVLLEEKQEEISIQNDELMRHRNELGKLVDERTKELKASKIKAEESDKLKSAFLANMSHEIRTPMNAIIGFSALLDDDFLQPDERDYYIRMIKNNGDTLLTLINDILDISIIEINQLVLYKDNFCIDDVLNEILSYYSLKNDKNLDIQIVKSGSRKKTYLNNDPVRFRQVMTNLVGNAIKFTEKGSVIFGYTLNDNSIDIFVEDTGIGISEKEQSRIFDHFHKIEPDETKLYQGTGIGLSISKKLANLMGGDITIESKIDVGTKFHFILPKTIDKKLKTEKPEIDSQQISLKDVNIIIAEDEINNYQLMERLLRKTEANLYWAHNGKEAVNFVKNICRDNNCIVLMDIKMPVMNGIEALKRIQKINSNIPVIAVTAYAQAGDKTRIMKNNFDDYISKPLQPKILMETLSYHYSRLLKQKH